MEYSKNPGEIEEKSMRLIRPYIAELALTDGQAAVYSRIIHASGDPEYAKYIRQSPGAELDLARALREGADVFCDVEMVRTGINKRRLAELGGQAHCLIADERVAAQAKAQGVTRAALAVKEFGARLNGAVVAVGNAPTALFALLELIDSAGIRPAFVVGVPVGFVGAAESKAALIQRRDVPYITVCGTRGGSPIAAAVINAALYSRGE
jgi:precorrin-8X/cobalt-precorrin-8 methylmutase